MKYTIITPLARFHNYEKLKEMLQSQIKDNIKLTWAVIIDDSFGVNIVPNENWIKIYICPGNGTEFWERCNNSINWYLNNNPISMEDKYLFLNDDDCYEPRFFEKLEKVNGRDKIIAVSMKRGNKIPSGVDPRRAHQPTTLWARPENMVVCQVGVEQVAIPGEIMKNWRLPIHICGDGIMIQAIIANNREKVVYLEDAYVHFNYLEPERWD